MRPTPRLAILLASGFLALGGCILTPGGVQLLELHFGLSETVVSGAESLVHQQLLPAEVVLKKHQVRVSGLLSGSASQPERIDVLVTAEDAGNGKVYDRFRLKVELRPDGGFSATGKWRKNIRPDTLLKVFVTPVGGDLPEGAEVDLCVHMTRSKAALRDLLDCAPGTLLLPPAFELELDSVGFHELFSEPGAFPKDLGPTAGRELVVALRDVTRPDQQCPDEIPWDGCATVDWDDVAGTRNVPPGGGYFDNRIRVTTESGPLDLYLNRELGLSREQDDDFALQ
ncbi:MAG: hypothetical protein R3325_09920 [Thermoanaerobaculia bacterium]|nr:hypothetical protein [Thermoanaerobaculia bacterium]